MSALEVLLAFFILSFWTLFPLALYFSTKDLSENEEELMRIGKGSQSSSLPQRFWRRQH